MNSRDRFISSLDLRKIQHMLALSEHRSFSEAAQALNITQSALSRSIQSLEDALETKLFERTTRYVTLTPAGEFGLAAAASILSNAADFHHSVSSAKPYSRPEFCVGMGTAMASVFGSMLLQYFLPDNPEFKLVLKVDAPENLFDHLLSEDLNVVIGTAETTPNSPYFVTTEIARFCRGFFANVDHPLAGKQHLGLSDIQKFTTVASLPMPDNIVKIIEKLYAPQGFGNFFQLQSNHHESLLNLILTSPAIVFGVNLAYLNHIKRGTVVQLNIEPSFPEDMSITITHLTGCPPPTGVATLANALRAWSK